MDRNHTVNKEKQLRCRIKELMPRIEGLAQGWSVDIAVTAVDRYPAEISYMDSERKAWIKIDPCKVSVDDLSQILIHELTHLVTRDYDHMVQTVVKSQVPTGQEGLILALTEDHLERICDHIASVIIKLL